MSPVILLALAGFAAAQAGAPLQRAAALYHQGRFDSALSELGAVRSQESLKRRDSLSLFQYSGMASARLGREDEASGHFGGLLDMDSLFQFPRNENPLVLAAFTRARRERERRAISPTLPEAAPVPASGISAASPAWPSTPTPTSAPALAKPFVFADSGIGRQQTPKAQGIGFAMGAVPLGGGWLVRRQPKHGLTLGFLQAAGLGLSLYASGRIALAEGDAFGIRDQEELASVRNWQWVQRVSLSAALGAYLFSLIAATGE